jgi:shikimate kinase
MSDPKNGGTAGAHRAIVLVGFMGAGKSRVGMAAAHRLRLPFVDTDTLISEQLGPIDQIFATQGEAAFRAVERNVVVTVLEKMRTLPCVASLGGGAVLHAEVRSAARRLPHVVLLSAPVEVLYERARGGGRPLATTPEAFAALLESRQALYDEVATVRILNDGARPFTAVVDEVVGLADLRAADVAGERERP